MVTMLRFAESPDQHRSGFLISPLLPSFRQSVRRALSENFSRVALLVLRQNCRFDRIMVRKETLAISLATWRNETIN